MKKINTPIPRHSLADAVVGRLQQQISLGVYKPGEKLPSEPELMIEFGVGRSTIREAVRILANTGLVTVRQGSGTMVETQRGITEPLQHRLRRANAADLDEVRQLLEIKIAEKAALLRTSKDITKMRTLLEERKAAAESRDIEGAIRTDIQFHVATAVAARNGILADLYRSVAEQMSRHFHQTYLTTDSFIETQQLHEQLLQSIIDQDQKKAWQYAAKIAAH
ncbi:FadR/GntR family transcriptional regulator [Puia sp.]|jgi:DNA-binding FadR family transcriptional regulator|uniref:FadR/GntR family transcriptional regulator n=1 Tax=Puia sp. TaxID=2045100 RepID=UPI002F41D570